MVNRYYSSIAVETTITTASINAAASSVTVASTDGFPSVPFTLALDYNTATEELVTVVAKSGNVLSITRGVDGTTATSHDVGAVVKHVASARDFTEPQQHIAATTGVHGVTGALAAASTLTSHINASTGVHGITGALASATDLASHTGATTTVHGISNTANLAYQADVSVKLNKLNDVVTSPFETVTVSATAATGIINFDVKTQAVLYYTTAASGNFTMNFRGNSTTSLADIVSVGQSVTVVFLCTGPTSTGYYNSAVTIDSTSVTPKWISGAAPTTGSFGTPNPIDAYSYTIIRTASGWTVFASVVKFA